MRCRRKIGVSFLLLSFLTIATGGIGLLFIYRVLGAYAAVPGVGGPSTAGLAELNRATQESVALSQAISGDNEIEDVLQLRRQFRLSRN